MGNKKQKQLIILIIVLLIAGIIVYMPSASVEITKKHNLKQMLGPVHGYEMVSSVGLNDEIVSFLDLDDYTQTTYTADGKRISLYIGYYYSLEKLSAAHSPLVCFPGQGWHLSQPEKKSLKVGIHAVNYMEMIGELGDNRQLIMYWYQAYEKTAPEIYLNKINGVVNKITGRKGEHAFVRVTVTLEKSDKEMVESVGQDFIKVFYPVFLDYINDSPDSAPGKTNKG